MSFGVTNDPAIFMDLMNQVQHPFIDSFMIVFIGDILIYSCDMVGHEKYLRTILNVLKDKQL